MGGFVSEDGEDGVKEGGELVSAAFGDFSKAKNTAFFNLPSGVLLLLLLFRGIDSYLNNRENCLKEFPPKNRREILETHGCALS